MLLRGTKSYLFILKGVKLQWTCQYWFLFSFISFLNCQYFRTKADKTSIIFGSKFICWCHESFVWKFFYVSIDYQLFFLFRKKTSFFSVRFRRWLLMSQTIVNCYDFFFFFLFFIFYFSFENSSCVYLVIAFNIYRFSHHISRVCWILIPSKKKKKKRKNI